MARLARPLTTLERSPSVAAEIQRIVSEERVSAIIVGLPRGLDGQETVQTRATRAFAAELATTVTVPLHFQDEATTSLQAEAELKSRGKPFAKSNIDALAATYILEDYMQRVPA